MVLLIYLNRTYSYFFDNIGAHKLPSPFTQTEYLIGQKNNIYLIKYAALGDSLTAGVGANTVEETFSYNFAEKIATDSQVLHRNEGYPAAKVHDLLSKIETIKQFDPQVVTILIGINDAFNRTPIQDYRNDLNTLISELKAQDRTIYLVTIPYLGTTKSVYFPFNILYDLQLNRYNTVIRDLSQDHSIKLIDLYSLSKKEFSSNWPLYSADQFHPSGKGYILISDLIFTEVKRDDATSR
jgi:lysophospholipase L1-like esterase